MFMPRALSAITDGRNALDRISRVFQADMLDSELVIDPRLSEALVVKDASFQWEAAGKSDDDLKKSRSKHRTRANESQTTENALKDEQEPFSLKNLSFSIPRGGAIYAIVGPIGSGKSSLFNG